MPWTIELCAHLPDFGAQELVVENDARVADGTVGRKRGMNIANVRWPIIGMPRS